MSARHKVKKELPKMLPKAKQMFKTQPLSIQQDAKVNEHSGYKAGTLKVSFLQLIAMMVSSLSDRGC